MRETTLSTALASMKQHFSYFLLCTLLSKFLYLVVGNDAFRMATIALTSIIESSGVHDLIMKPKHKTHLQQRTTLLLPTERKIYEMFARYFVLMLMRNRQYQNFGSRNVHCGANEIGK